MKLRLHSRARGLRSVFRPRYVMPHPEPRANSEQQEERKEAPDPRTPARRFLEPRRVHSGHRFEGRLGFPLRSHQTVSLLRVAVCGLLIVRSRQTEPPVAITSRIVVVLPRLVRKLKCHTASRVSPRQFFPRLFQKPRLTLVLGLDRVCAKLRN